MICRTFRHSILIVLLPFALTLQGCASIGGAYLVELKSSLATNNVPPGSDHGTLEDVHRLYRNRQYADALDGVNYLLQNNSLS